MSLVNAFDRFKTMLYSSMDFLLGLIGIDTYRLATRAHALYSLATIDGGTIDRYMKSYILFDGDWSNDNGKSEDSIVDYYQVIQPLVRFWEMSRKCTFLLFVIQTSVLLVTKSSLNLK